jgi:hypothetical protein
MNDIEKLNDYRDAIAAVRMPKLADRMLAEYMEGARRKALAEIDCATEMRNPTRVTEILSKQDAKDRGMVPVGCCGAKDAWWHKPIIRDMERGNITHALVREGKGEDVSVWRVPNASWVPPTLLPDEEE